MPDQYNAILLKDSIRLVRDLWEYVYDMVAVLILNDTIMKPEEFLSLINGEEHAE